MVKLTLRERLLYKRKKYDALSKLMRRTKEGAARFNQLCIQDAGLQVWIGRTHLTVAAAIFRNPKLKAAMKETAEREGMGKLFDLHKTLDEKGFVTIEEAAAAFGITTDEMKATITAHPAIFKEWHISG